MRFVPLATLKPDDSIGGTLAATIPDGSVGGRDPTVCMRTLPFAATKPDGSI